MGYLANFMVYTLAMIGIIAIALLVFKGSNSFGSVGKSKYLKIIDSLTIAPRKTLYVISTGREKFLIAGDVGNTTLISKLETPNNELENHKNIESVENIDNINIKNSESFKATMSNLAVKGYSDRSNLGIKSSLLSQKQSVMKNLVEKMK